MKKLIIKSLSFLVIIVSILSFILLYYGGRVDSFYYKFTTPKAKSMIIGDSNGLEGIMPSVIDEKVNKYGFELPMLNYSFTIAQARIGPLYRKSIIKKLDPKTKNGLFILSINPFMLLSDNTKNNYNNEFSEANQPPHNMVFDDINPNFEYLVKNCSFFHFKALFKNKIELHKDGWLQDNNLPTSDRDFKNRRDTWIKSYQSFSENFSPSNYRLKSLDTLIKQLKGYGKVYLVKMPIDKIFYPMENEIYPDFDKQIDSLSLINDVVFYNYYKKDNKVSYKTLDGVHLNKYASKKFTSDLCDSIISDIQLHKKIKKG